MFNAGSHINWWPMKYFQLTLLTLLTYYAYPLVGSFLGGVSKIVYLGDLVVVHPATFESYWVSRWMVFCRVLLGHIIQ